MAFIKETGRTENGKTYSYKHLVQSYKDEDGVTRHEYLLNLSDVPDRIVQILEDGLDDDKTTVNLDQLQTDTGDAVRGAGQLALWRAWEKLEMDQLFEAFSDKQIQSIKVMVFARITDPGSKRALSEQMADTLLSKLYTDNRLDEDTLYGVMDQLADQFYEIQQQLNNQPDNPEHELLLYDTTSTYFEGTQAEGGEYGHSKDKRWDRYQVIVGVVTNGEGMPVAVEVWPGNTHDASTINDRIQALRNQFGFEEVTFVGDSGTYGTNNIETIQEAGFDYIISLAYQKQRNMLTDLAPAQRKLFDREGVYEWEEDGTRYVGCHSEGRCRRARARRLDAMKSARDELDRLSETAGSGAYYTKQRLTEKVGQMLQKKGVRDLFTVSIQREDEVDQKEKCRLDLDYQLDMLALRQRRALEGKYILETSLPEKQASSEQIESEYKKLQNVERGFRHIKSYLNLRPVYHRLWHRIKAHVLICFLAYYMVRWIENQLREQGVTEEVERVINRWDQLELVSNRLEVEDYVHREQVWSRGEVGEKIVDEIREIGWWRSMEGYKRGIKNRMKQGG